jgi:hypothetical protein
VYRRHYGVTSGKAEAAVNGVGLVGTREVIEYFDGGGNVHR